MNAEKVIVPKLPGVLGYAGLIPFVVLAAGAWLAPLNYLALIDKLLLSYAACILAFMGAIHWGVPLSDRPNSWQLGLSVIPALVAWLSLNLPSAWSYSLLIVSFVSLCMIDGIVTKRDLCPQWYPRLRTPLTSIVVLSLIVSAFAP